MATEEQPLPQKSFSEQPQWMPKPVAVNCPRGLEYLTEIDQILVHQQVELCEAMTGWQVTNRYVIKNSVGQQVYFAQEEEGDQCERQCCKNYRGFTFTITDNNKQEVMRVVREFKCWAGCCWCANSDACGWELSVEAPPGNHIGSVRQEQSYWTPKFCIRDANGQVAARIKGPCCVCECAGDLDFVVYSADLQHEIGRTIKQWSGCFKECATNADNFGITFPMDLDVKMKACMLASVFLIDFMFFEMNN